jgi:hypothetical protein
MKIFFVNNSCYANYNNIEMWHGLRGFSMTGTHSSCHVWAREHISFIQAWHGLRQSHRKPCHANTFQFAMRNIS